MFQKNGYLDCIAFAIILDDSIVVSSLSPYQFSSLLYLTSLCPKLTTFGQN